MNEIKWKIKAIASQFDMSISELAVECGINPNHLLQVSSGYVRMLAEDALALSKFSGIPVADIKTDYK